MSDAANPKTLQDAVIHFANPDVAHETMVKMRWPNGVACPTCGNIEVKYRAKRRTWRCREHSKNQDFSVKNGTIFEDSPISLSKWLTAVWLIANAKNGISSYELARSIGVTQKTGWFMLQRIRKAMQAKTFDKLGGEVEADETHIGGKARNMHKGRRKISGRGAIGKAVVLGLLERHGPDKPHSTVRAAVIPRPRKYVLQGEVIDAVEPGATVYTDELASYEGLADSYEHKVINHAQSYARGNVHTNGLENFWSLLKRSLFGTYVSVEPFHLFRYLDEQAYRFNHRKQTDAERFAGVLGSGRRTARDIPRTHRAAGRFVGATELPVPRETAQAR